MFRKKLKEEEGVREPLHSSQTVSFSNALAQRVANASPELQERIGLVLEGRADIFLKKHFYEQDPFILEATSGEEKFVPLYLWNNSTDLDCRQLEVSDPNQNLPLVPRSCWGVITLMGEKFGTLNDEKILYIKDVISQFGDRVIYTGDLRTFAAYMVHVIRSRKLFLNDKSIFFICKVQSGPDQVTCRIEVVFNGDVPSPRMRVTTIRNEEFALSAGTQIYFLL